jgi:hypothetical protein
MPFDANLAGLGMHDTSQKCMDSQLSTTADMTNTMASFTMTSSIAMPQIKATQIEQEIIDPRLESQKKLNESIKTIEKHADYKLWECTTGSVCYPDMIGNRPVIVFEEAEEFWSKKKPEMIVEEGNMTSDQELDQELNYHLYPKDFESLSNYTFWGYYTQYVDFLSAVRYLIFLRCSEFTSNVCDNVYFSMLYSSYMVSLLSDKHSSKFYGSQAADLDSIVNHWKDWKITSSQYPRVPRCSRQYVEITDYQPAVNRCSTRD